MCFQRAKQSTRKLLFSLKKLSVLDLGPNSIRQADMSIFKEFNNLTDLSMKENKMFPQKKETIFFLNIWEKRQLESLPLQLERGNQVPCITNMFDSEEEQMYYSENQHCKSYHEVLNLGIKIFSSFVQNSLKILRVQLVWVCLQMSLVRLSMTLN